MRYFIPQIRTGVLLFPFIALFITIPYMVSQYRKYGSIVMIRTLIIYSFVFYLLCCYLLVILPLPSFETVEQMKVITPQLTPFMFVNDFIMKSKFIWQDPSTYIDALLSTSFTTVFFNIMLFMPFGIYLRYYFKRSWLQVLTLTFLLTLFFELTQLSGLYGIYPKAYRIFDIDDLITNTFGGMLGYLITPMFSFFLPKRETIDQKAYQKGTIVSYPRRIFAIIIDWSCIFLLIIFSDLIFNIPSTLSLFSISVSSFFVLYVLAVILVFVIIPTLTNGYTLGKYMVRIRVIASDQTKIQFYHYLYRYGLLYFIILPAPFTIISLLTFMSKQHYLMNIILMFAIIFITLIFVLAVVHFFMAIFSKNRLLSYEIMSKTKNISTIKIE